MAGNNPTPPDPPSNVINLLERQIPGYTPPPPDSLESIVLHKHVRGPRPAESWDPTDPDPDDRTAYRPGRFGRTSRLAPQRESHETTARRALRPARARRRGLGRTVGATVAAVAVVALLVMHEIAGGSRPARPPAARIGRSSVDRPARSLTAARLQNTATLAPHRKPRRTQPRRAHRHSRSVTPAHTNSVTATPVRYTQPATQTPTATNPSQPDTTSQVQSAPSGAPNTPASSSSTSPATGTAGSAPANSSARLSTPALRALIDGVGKCSC
jgi:hypothetical protein